MMVYLDLFIGFLKVGCFAFGGGYGAIALIRDIVLSYGWLDDEMLTYMIGVSESTPGPIMVNMATYIGSSQAGLAGAAIATLAVALPSFFIILLVSAVFQNALKNRYIQAVLRGLKPCVIGIVLATGISMILKNALGDLSDWDGTLRSLLLTAIAAAVLFGWPKLTKKKLSPIALILICSLLGILIY